MTPVRVKGFKIFRDRHGAWRCYHRKTGQAVDLKAFPIGSAAFYAECAKVDTLAAASEQKPQPGTLGGLIAKYRQSPNFRDLAPRTRWDYDRWFEYLRPIHQTRLNRFTPPLVVGIRDKAARKHGRRGGNYVRTVLSSAFDYGRERGYLKENTAKAVKPIKRPRNAPQANRPWTDAERFVVLDTAPQHLQVPIALCMYMGMRQGDALRLSKSAYDGQVIKFRTGKTGSEVASLAPEALAAILDAAPTTNATTIATNSHGLPWTESGFRSSWHTFRKRLENDGSVQPGLTIHGLRHTRATHVREAGYDDRTVADTLGQETEAMARHYSKHADTRAKLDPMVAHLDEIEREKRGKVSNLHLKSVKPGGHS